MSRWEGLIPACDMDVGNEVNAEHVLFINVLDRAMRDLRETESEVHRSAYNWFRSWENTMPHGISYKDVRDAVDIGFERLKKIEVLLHEYRTKTFIRIPFKHARLRVFR